MPTVSCRRCHASVDVSDRSRIGRVFCPTCGEWFTLDREVEDPLTAISTGPIDRPPRPGGPREVDLDDDEPIDDEPIDDEARRRIRRRQRHIAAEENDPVRPPEGRGVGLAAQILIGLVGAFELAALILCVRLLVSERNRFDAMFTLMSTSGFESLAFLAAGVVFVSWLAKAHRNIQFLRAPMMHWSSGWAVGGFFLPLANLAIPYLVMQEMWRAVHPGRADESEIEPQPATASGLIIAWWIVWVAANCLNFFCRQFAGGFLFDGNTTVLFGSIVAHGLFVLDAPLAILVIRAMIRRQEERWKTLVEEAGADA